MMEVPLVTADGKHLKGEIVPAKHDQKVLIEAIQTSSGPRYFVLQDDGLYHQVFPTRVKVKR